MVSLDPATLWLTVTRLIIILATIGLGWMTYQSNLLLKKFRPDFNLLLSPPETILRILLVGLCLFLVWLSGLPAGQFGLTSENVGRSLAVGVAIGGGVQIILNLLSRWAIAQFGQQIYSPIILQSIVPRRLAEWLPVSIALIPAVAMEELLFRSLWLGGFEPVLPLWLVVVLTSVMFGLMHLPQGTLGVILTATINVVFCGLFIWSGELLIPLVAHYTINMLQLLLAYTHRDWFDNYPVTGNEHS